MIPILYDRYETSFTTNGIGRLADCISCTVTEERNGMYELEFEYPITGQYYSSIEHGCIVYATHDDLDDPQPFVIYGHTKPINGIVTFYASHISYELNKVVVEPFSASSCAAALVGIEGHEVTDSGFTYWTDKTTQGEFSLATPTEVRPILGGIEGSILDIYGGEYEWDKFTVKLHARRGTDTGVEIRYGKNLVDLTEESDSSSLFDGVVPFWYGETEEGEPVLVSLPEKAVVYAGANGVEELLATENLEIIQTENGVDILDGGRRISLISLDLSDQFEEPPTAEELRSAAQSYLNNAEGWLSITNIEVDFVQLWQTEEYAEYAPLQRVRLCDTVSIYFPELGVVRVRQKVVKTTYNVLLDRYDSIELGTLQQTYGQVLEESFDFSQFVTGDQLTRLEASIAAMTEDLKTQLDSKVETWYQATNPATNWTTADDRAAHAGDLWCYTGQTTSSYINLGIYRYNYDPATDTGTWVDYDAASELFDEIDGKTTIYYGSTSGTYPNVNTGDYLVDPSDGCTYRWSGQWIKVTDYNAAIAALKGELESQIDAKIETWAQSTSPANAWTTAERPSHNGDLWLYTGTSNITVGGVTIHPQGVYQYNSSTNRWSAYSSTTNNLFDLADGKTTIYYGSPSGTYSNVAVGDYLVDSTDGCTYRWTGSTWQKVTDYMSAMQSTIEAAVQNATGKITGAQGGYVYIKPNANGYPQEILIMNRNDYTTATKLWRWNINGLGYSKTGYSGTYSTAITMDGAIVADFITTGTLNANIIKAGVLSDTGGNTSFDLSTGNLRITNGSINLGNGLFEVTSAGVFTAHSGKIGPFTVVNGASDAARSLRATGTLGTVSLGTSGITCYPPGSTISNTFLQPDASSLLGQVYVNDTYTEICSPDESVLINITDSDITMKPGTGTFGAAPNLYLGGTGLLRKTTGSSRQIKKNIADLKNKEISAENLYNLEVVQFKYNTKSGLDKEDQRFDALLPGFILEQMDEVYPVAIDKNDTDDPKEWRWNQMYLIPPMVKLIQDQHQEIDELKEELAKIKERISHLEEGK